MKCLVVSTEEIFPKESQFITALLEADLEYFHLRKRKASLEDLSALLSDIPEQFHKRIITHSHFELLNQYDLKGIHLTGKTIYKYEEYSDKNIHISMSCANFYDVFLLEKTFEYVMLAPIYDSISKPQFKSCFTMASLQEFFDKYDGVNKIVAYRGINHERLDQVKDIGFAGAALQGVIWKEEFLADIEIFSDNFKTLQKRSIELS